jgi:hypothetical protein
MDHRDILCQIFDNVTCPKDIIHISCASPYYNTLLQGRREQITEYDKLLYVMKQIFSSGKHPKTKITLHSENYPFQVLSFSADLCCMDVGYMRTSFQKTSSKRYWRMFETELRHISSAGIDEITIWISPTQHYKGIVFNRMKRQLESALDDKNIQIYVFNH